MPSISRRIALIIAAVTLIMGTSAVYYNGDKYFEIAKNIEIFTNVYKQLNTHYVDELEPNQLIRTGIDAMMESLDPYTVYYSESQVESYRISDDAKYSGLGAASEYIDDHVTITEIYENGPAQDAGLQVGDQMIRINGQSTDDRSYDDVMKFIRGHAGTALELTVRRPSDGSTHELSITRSEVEIENVPYYGMVSDHVGYINLTTFTRDAAKNIAKGIRDMRDDNELAGLIIDLRDNGGGLLSEAIDILGLLLPQGTPVVSTRGKVREKDQNYSTRRLPIDIDLPVVVLVNGSSASASEIVSGSIQDLDRGVIMGQRTYGKGLVQNHQEVGYNSRIKVTISKYYIPSGRCIQSVAYENGEPKEVSDADRETFYTRNRRPVLDGGGVAPDVGLDPETAPEVLEALRSGHWIFHYVNDYVQSRPAPESFEEFSYDDYDEFLSYLEEEKFTWKSKNERAMEKFEKEVSSDLASQLASMSDQIAAEKANDLSQYQKIIHDEIESELAKRYFFQEGKTRQMLKDDREVNEAISLLLDQKKYNKILKQ